MREPTRAQLEVKLLGTFQIARLDGPIPSQAWRQRKTQTLLKLLCERGRVFSQDQLIDALFPELDPQKARINLQARVSELRRTLEPDLKRGGDSQFIRRAGSGYLFPKDAPCWVDIEAFQDALQAAAEQEQNQRWAQALERYDFALSLWRGEFLVEDLYEEWTQLARGHWKELYLNALERAGECHTQLGQYAQAVACCQKVIQQAPGREQAYALKMKSHHYAGQHQQALETYQACASALKDLIGLEPSADTRKLYLQIREGALVRQGQETPHNLMEPATRFIGREDELVLLHRQLEEEGCRLLTLIGPGGVGKTRLALQLASERLMRHPHGVFFVPLASLQEAGQLALAVREALSLGFAGTEELKAQLLDYLKDKKLLLVMDNFEHLLEGAGFIHQLLEQAPDLHVLATSRQRLNLQGEVLHEVSGLSLPAEGAQPSTLVGYDAIRLFLESAKRADPGFKLTEQALPQVRSICNQVGGLPLGIELAAAWLRVIPLEEIAAEIESNPDLLATTAHDVPERHRSVRAVFESTWQQLSAHERAAFMNLSVFRGGFSREAASQVADVSLSELTALMNQSLLARCGPGRYELHELLRQYGAIKLKDSGHKSLIQRRHVQYFRTLSEQAELMLQGPEQVKWLNLISAELDNLREALAAALELGEVEQEVGIAGALWQFWVMRGHFKEAMHWLQRGLEQGKPISAAVRAKGCSAAGTMAWLQGQMEQAKSLHQESLSLYQALGDQHGVAFTLNHLGVVTRDAGDAAEGKRLLQESLALYRSLPLDYLMVYPLNNLGALWLNFEQYPEAKACFEEALVLGRQRGNPWIETFVLYNLGELAYHQGFYDQAFELFGQAMQKGEGLRYPNLAFHLRLSQGVVAVQQKDLQRASDLFKQGLEQGLKFGGLFQEKANIMVALISIARVEKAQRPAKAAGLLDAAHQLKSTFSIQLPEAEQNALDQLRDELRSQLGEQAFFAASAHGQDLSLEQAVQYALKPE